MVASQGSAGPTFGGPGVYRIVVRGRLDPQASERLQGMKITPSTEGQARAVTTLSGRLKDQAQLRGLLNELYEMHFVVLNVECQT